MSEDSLARTRNRMLIGTKIYIAIKNKGLTQKQFAAMMGKTESEISDWISGDRNFTIDTMTDIERALGIRLIDSSALDKYQYTETIEPVNIIPFNSGNRKSFQMSFDTKNQYSHCSNNFKKVIC